MAGVGGGAGAAGTVAHGVDGETTAANGGRPPERRRAWVRLRLVLGALWALLVVVTAVGTVVQPARSDLTTLYADVATGRTTSVALTPGLGTDGEGQLEQAARWTADGQERTATWQVVRGLTDTPPDTGTITVDDVASELQERAPGLVVVEDLGAPPRTDVLGVAFGDRAGPATVPFLVVWLATLWLLVNGPEPYRATRWAWFWLSAPPLGLLAFVVLSGPTPGLGIRRPAGRRLGGVRAFVLTLLLGAVVASPWWW